MNLILTSESVLRLFLVWTLATGSQNQKYPPSHKKDVNLAEAEFKQCYAQFCSCDNLNTATRQFSNNFEDAHLSG